MTPFWVNVYDYVQRDPLNTLLPHTSRGEAWNASAATTQDGYWKLLYRVKVTPKVAAR